MAVAGFYRRELPSPPAIEFASPKGRRLFSEALQKGMMEGFFKLISHFQTQSEPAYCGLASLSMVLNALAIDPRRKWKGSWRWYDESMLDCCEPLEKVKAEGITFGNVVCLAQCAGAKVEAFRTTESNIDDFRNHVIKCTSSEDCHLIASYNRKHLKQTGTGHFSPISGFHIENDMVLILDVARFKYPPHWIPLPLLWEAMDTIDQATGHTRGFMLISSNEIVASLLYTLSCRDESWLGIANYLIDDVPMLLKSEEPKNVPEVLSLILKFLPASAGDFIKWFAEVKRREEGGSTVSKEEKERLAKREEILEQVRQTELFKCVRDILYSSTSIDNIREKGPLPGIAANLWCQGAALISGGLTCSTEICCGETLFTCLKSNGDKPTTVVSGTVVSGDDEKIVDMLVPSGSCCSSTLGNGNVIHPANDDVLTVLLLVLPASTWLGFKDVSLLAEIQDLVSTENLPDALQQEVLHLRHQLHCLKRCKDKKVDDDLNFPACI